MRDGKVVLAKGYGKRLLEKAAAVVPDTMFAVGSVTKQFTCACILLLAEEGKLSIDDKVAKYEPNLTRAGDITLHDLMTHTFGIPRLLSARLRGPAAGQARSARRRCWRSTPAPSSTSSRASAGRTATRATRCWADVSPR